MQLKYNDETVLQKRNTISETYKAIVDDFEKSMTLMDRKNIDPTQLNYWAAQALLSRAYLYMGDYNNALKCAIDVIDNSGAKLYTRENYLESWMTVGGDESLFEVATTEKANPQRNSLGYHTNPDGYAEAGASELFLDFFKTLSDKDIRKQTVVEKAADKGKNKGMYTTKYMGQKGVSNQLYVNNGRVIRLSEVYLIAAEAALKGGTAPGAQDAAFYYNELRKNRIAEYTPVTAVTIDDLLNERRIELFCENHRMFDLVRNQRDIQTANVVEKVVKYTDLKRVLMAIPEREINASKDNMKQNPGWN